MTLYWVALNSIKGLGPVKINTLIEYFKTPEAIFKENNENLQRTGLVSSQIIKQIRNPETIRNAELLIEQSNKAHVTILTLSDSQYPSYLKQIFAPPPLLFTKGDLSLFEQYAVSIVGTRTPTQYGKNATCQIVKGLIRNNLVVVSGLARGIDTIAHEYTLSLNKPTIAVLGCGIDIIYPKMNLQLAERIVNNGILVSEFNPGTAPEAYNFPRRNRIISGLSAATVVVEAGERSGSLITADYALQQGRDVFAVPGPITSSMSSGTFKLLREGAIPARSGDEIAETLSVMTLSSMKRLSDTPPVSNNQTLPENERSIIDQLSNQPTRIDDLLQKVSCPINDLFGILLNLELKGLIQQVSGQQYIRVDTV